MTKLSKNSWLRASSCVWVLCLLVGWSGLIATGSVAVADESRSRPGVPSATVGTRRALIVCGLPGDDDHRKLFAETVEKLHKALTGGRLFRLRGSGAVWC